LKIRHNQNLRYDHSGGLRNIAAPVQTGLIMAVINLLTTQWTKLRNNLLLRRLLTVLSLDILVKASAIILLPIYLRLMTQDDYGVFNYILSITYAFSILLNLGLYIPQSKLSHDYSDPTEKGKLYYSINMLLFGSCLFLVAPIYIFRLDYYAVSILFKNAIHYDRYRLWVLLLTLTSLFAYMLTNYFYTVEMIDMIKKYSFSRVIGINVISILALYFLKKRDAIVIRFISIGVVEGLLLIIFYRHYIRKWVTSLDKRLAIKCLKLGLPVMLSNVFNIIINFGDKFFLEKNVSYKTLSIYYLGFSCASVISLLSNSLQNVWLPLFFKEKDLLRNLAKTRKMVLRLVWILTGLSLVILLAVIVCLRLSIIPGNYGPIVYVLPLLLAGQIVICLALLYSNYLIYFEKTSLILWSGLAVSAVSTLLNMLLIPKWQIYGAATTLLVANSCYLVIYYFIIKYYKERHLLSKGIA
jgi:O-antigen/teichoic acid export membrane protein